MPLLSSRGKCKGWTTPTTPMQGCYRSADHTDKRPSNVCHEPDGHYACGWSGVYH